MHNGATLTFFSNWHVGPIKFCGHWHWPGAMQIPLFLQAGRQIAVEREREESGALLVKAAGRVDDWNNYVRKPEPRSGRNSSRSSGRSNSRASWWSRRWGICDRRCMRRGKSRYCTLIGRLLALSDPIGIAFLSRSRKIAWWTLRSSKCFLSFS